jgi:hypothetical protein
VGTKLRICPECGHKTRIGMSKKICKSCRIQKQNKIRQEPVLEPKDDLIPPWIDLKGTPE